MRTTVHNTFFYRLMVCAAALAINLFFLAFHDRTLFFDGLLLPHGEIGYNLCHHNSIKVNPQRMAHVASLQKKIGARIDYEDVDHAAFGAPTEFRTINDTVGYGVLLGLLWKVTGACRYWYVQLLQVLLFSLSMWLFFEVALLIFGNAQAALFCSIAQLFFFPLAYLNVQALRDIWAYYALLLVLYLFLQSVQKKMAWGLLAFLSILFAVFQHLRPTVFFTLITLTMVFLWWCRGDSWQRVARAALFLWCANVAFFWIPFMAYNKSAYDHWLVAPAGQDLYEGLGEFPNDKDLVMDDEQFARDMRETYGLTLGTVACDAKGKELFWQVVKNDPLFYLRCLAQRVRFLFLFNPRWGSGVDNLFAGAATLRQKLVVIFHAPGAALMKCIDYAGSALCYVEFFLLLGWLGCLVLLLQKKFLPVLVIMAVIVSGWSKFPSHMEARYLVTFYWSFSFFVGYLLWFLKNSFSSTALKK